MRTLRICALCALATAGCAMGGMAKTAPAEARAPEPPAASAEEARARIDELEGRIAALRGEIGLAAPGSGGGVAQTTAIPATPSGAAPSGAEREAPAEAPPPPPAPRAPVATPPASRPAGASASPGATLESTTPRSAPRRTSRCQKVDQATAEICDASERICRLADEIADTDAARSCTRAREDCRNAATVANRCL